MNPYASATSLGAGIVSCALIGALTGTNSSGLAGLAGCCCPSTTLIATIRLSTVWAWAGPANSSIARGSIRTLISISFGGQIQLVELLAPLLELHRSEEHTSELQSH